jgi:hypothetical protein
VPEFWILLLNFDEKIVIILEKNRKVNKLIAVWDLSFVNQSRKSSNMPINSKTVNDMFYFSLFETFFYFKPQKCQINCSNRETTVVQIMIKILEWNNHKISSLKLELINDKNKVNYFVHEKGFEIENVLYCRNWFLFSILVTFLRAFGQSFWTVLRRKFLFLINYGPFGDFLMMGLNDW